MLKILLYYNSISWPFFDKNVSNSWCCIDFILHRLISNFPIFKGWSVFVFLILHGYSIVNLDKQISNRKEIYRSYLTVQLFIFHIDSHFSLSFGRTQTMKLYYIMLLFWAKLQILFVEKKRWYSMKICNFFSIKFRYCEKKKKN